MLLRQDQPGALRLLIAQRQLHSRAKVWQACRWTGLLLIGLAAPVASIIWPDLAVLVGAIAGLWLFLGRTWLQSMEKSRTVRGAAVQEQFDFNVFRMPSPVVRSVLPTLEEIAALAGPDAELLSTARRRKLTGWYPMKPQMPGYLAVAIAQRSNAAYSYSLLRRLVRWWIVASVAWIVTLTGATIWFELSLLTFLAGIALPLLPATLDIFEYIMGIREAARDRRDLAASIESEIRSGNEISGQRLLVWQERMFELRCSTPQVPNWLYWATRTKNEAAMISAADQLMGGTSDV